MSQSKNFLFCDIFCTETLPLPWSFFLDFFKGDIQTSRHGNSMTEFAQWGRFSEKRQQVYPCHTFIDLFCMAKIDLLYNFFHVCPSCITMHHTSNCLALNRHVFHITWIPKHKQLEEKVTWFEENILTGTNKTKVGWIIYMLKNYFP